MNTADLSSLANYVRNGDITKLRSLPLGSVINNFFEGGTLLYIACNGGHLEIVKELLKHSNINVNSGVSILNLLN